MQIIRFFILEANNILWPCYKKQTFILEDFKTSSVLYISCPLIDIWIHNFVDPTECEEYILKSQVRKVNLCLV